MFHLDRCRNGKVTGQCPRAPSTDSGNRGEKSVKIATASIGHGRPAAAGIKTYLGTRRAPVLCTSQARKPHRNPSTGREMPDVGRSGSSKEVARIASPSITLKKSKLELESHPFSPEAFCLSHVHQHGERRRGMHSRSPLLSETCPSEADKSPSQKA